MKKIFTAILVLGLALSNYNALAQIEINAYTGYVPASKTAYSYNGYRLRIEGSQNFGGGLGMNTPVGLVEFNYMGYSSNIDQYGGPELPGLDLPQSIKINYYQLGVLKTIMEDEKFIPYGLISLGAANFNPEVESTNYWAFSLSLGLGIRYFFTPKFGIRLQARLLMPMYFGGIGMGCGIGTGGSSCGGGAYFGVDIFQGDFTGGVVFKINTQ